MPLKEILRLLAGAQKSFDALTEFLVARTRSLKISSLFRRLAQLARRLVDRLFLGRGLAHFYSVIATHKELRIFALKTDRPSPVGNETGTSYAVRRIQLLPRSMRSKSQACA